MSQTTINQANKVISNSNLSTVSSNTNESEWNNIIRVGGYAVLIQLACVLVPIIIAFTVGAEPATASEYFESLTDNRLVGLLRIDFATLLLICLFYITSFSVFAALSRTSLAYATLGAALIYVGTTLGLANHSAFSMIRLSDLYAAATTATGKEQLLAAGEAIIAGDMWNSTAGFLAGIFMQGAFVFLSIIMLKSKSFSKGTAYTGIISNGFDFVHVFVGLFAPAAGIILLYISGPFYLAWFALLARDLLRNGRQLGAAALEQV